jgi:hypothetical protein
VVFGLLNTSSKHEPWSFSAFLIAFLVIICATTIQELMASLGIALHFAIFVPAILIAALVSGFPAGAFSTSNGPDRLAGISGAPLRIQSSHRYRL